MLATLLPAVAEVGSGKIFMSEFLGTAVLLLLGGGVVATNLLPKSKGKGGGWLMINWGWGLAVLAGVYVAYTTGGHLNPAVTIAKVVGHMMDSSVELAPGIAERRDLHRRPVPRCIRWRRPVLAHLQTTLR